MVQKANTTLLKKMNPALAQATPPPPPPPPGGGGEAFPHYGAFESLNPVEIAKAANLFENLKQLRIKLKNGDEAVLERAFEYHVQGVLDKLDARLQLIQDPQQQNVELIMARHGLYDAAFQQIALLCHSSKFSSSSASFL